MYVAGKSEKEKERVKKGKSAEGYAPGNLGSDGFL